MSSEAASSISASVHSKKSVPKTPLEAFWRELRPFSRYIVQFCLIYFVSVLLQLGIAFATQAVVDVGIARNDVPFLYVLAIAHLSLLLGTIAGDTLLNAVLMHVGARVHLNMVTGFLRKLTELPLKFFVMRSPGDIMERVADNYRVKEFVMGDSFGFVMALLNVLVFGTILVMYNATVFFISVAGSLLAIGWTVAVLPIEKKIDNERFGLQSLKNGRLLEMVAGMEEIKVQNMEERALENWHQLHRPWFQLTLKSMWFSQLQIQGSRVINEVKRAIVSLVLALAVVDQQLTIGGMFAITYLLGNIDGPLQRVASFTKSAQAALLSTDRLLQVHQEPNDHDYLSNYAAIGSADTTADVTVDGLSFRYGGSDSKMILNNVSFTAPAGKVTAIVGMSGSGKTTLLRLILGLHMPTGGAIRVGDESLQQIDTRTWRKRCGVVMQSAMIFRDSVAQNIAGAERPPDMARVAFAAKVAEIEEFVKDLPDAYQTILGSQGGGMSGGQRQRLQIARAVYRDPEFFLLDEATSSLDVASEHNIIENLTKQMAGRTTIVIAHRLSTVRHADQIIVLNEGTLAEKGTHEELLANKGIYHNLVCTQLSD